MKNFSTMLRSPQATNDAEAVRSLRASLLEMHKQVAAKEEALKRLASLHTRLLETHEELQKRVGDEPQKGWTPTPATPAPPPSAAAVPEWGDVDDSPAWVTPAAQTPAAQSQAWSDAASLRTPMNGRTPAAVDAEVHELRDKLEAATKRAERAEAQLAVASARADAAGEEASNRADRAEAQLAAQLARSPASAASAASASGSPSAASPTPSGASPRVHALRVVDGLALCESNAASPDGSMMPPPGPPPAVPPVTPPAEWEAESKALRESVSAAVVAAAAADDRAEAAEVALESTRAQLAASEAELRQGGVETAALVARVSELEERLLSGSPVRRLGDTQEQLEAALSRAEAAEEAYDAGKEEVKALRDAEEASKRRLAAELWKLREEHHATQRSNEAALNTERARLKALRASLHEAKGEANTLQERLDEKAAAEAAASVTAPVTTGDQAWDEI